MNTPNKFTYNYNAPTQSERKEIEAIRKKYQPTSQSESTLARLRSLDKKVQRIPETLALSLGIVGILLFGLGLTCILEWTLFLLGAGICVLSIAPVALAYPLFRLSQKKLKEKYADEILSLSNQLLSDEQTPPFTNL